jgi:hypothetical protein
MPTLQIERYGLVNERTDIAGAGRQHLIEFDNGPGRLPGYEIDDCQTPDQVRLAGTGAQPLRQHLSRLLNFTTPGEPIGATQL